MRQSSDFFFHFEKMVWSDFFYNGKNDTAKNTPLWLFSHLNSFWHRLSKVFCQIYKRNIASVYSNGNKNSHFKMDVCILLYFAIPSFPKIEETTYGNNKNGFIFCKIYKDIFVLVFENKSESRSFLVPLGFPGGTSITLLKWKFLA